MVSARNSRPALNEFERTQKEVEAFMRARPGYTDWHVRTVGDRARLDGIPFCTVCKDWHLKTEKHTPLERRARK